MSWHARLSASESHRWMACPGSVSLSESLPRGQSGPAAALGTGVHSFAKEVLDLGIEAAASCLGEQVKFEDDGVERVFTVDEKVANAVQVYVDEVRSHASAPGAILYTELTVDLTWLHPDMGGTIDAVIWKPKTKELVVVDYKNGATPVRVEGNTQLRIYAIGAMHIIEKTTGLPVNKVTIVIVQPNCFEVEPVQREEVEVSDLVSWCENLRLAAEEASELEPRFFTGDHCKWCRAQSVCLAFSSKVMEITRSDFASVEKPKLPGVAKLTDAQVANVLKWAPVLDAWLREVEARAFSEALAGRPVKGFKLVRKKSNRKWPTDDPQVLHSMLIQAGLSSGKFSSIDDICERSVLSPAQIEKKAGKVGIEAVNAIAVKPKGSLTLANLDDPREQINPQGDFEDLSDENLL